MLFWFTIAAKHHQTMLFRFTIAAKHHQTMLFRFTIAAKHHQTIAEIYESEGADIGKLSK